MRTLRKFVPWCALLGLALSPLARAMEDPVELDAVDDSYLSADTMGLPAGRGAHNEVQLYGSADSTGYRVLLKFDLKAAPPGFRAAMLRLHCYNSNFTGEEAAYIHAHAVTSAWSENDASWDQRLHRVNWHHQGGDFDPRPVGGVLMEGRLTRPFSFQMDLTALARQWQAQPGNNHGVALMVEKGSVAEFRLRSKEFEDAQLRPKLVLYYRKEPLREAALLPAATLPPYDMLEPNAPMVSFPKPATLTLNEEFSTKFTAGGAQAPYVFRMLSQSVPGMALLPDGTFKGKPSRAGVYLTTMMCGAANGKIVNDYRRWVVVDPKVKPPEPPPEKKDGAAEKPKTDQPKAEPAKKPAGPAEE